MEGKRATAGAKLVESLVSLRWSRSAVQMSRLLVVMGNLRWLHVVSRFFEVRFDSNGHRLDRARVVRVRGLDCGGRSPT